MNTQTQSRPTNKWRILGWGTAAALLLTPLVAMQFTPEVKWDETDFLFAAILFGTVGGLIELTVRASGNGWYRGGAIFAVLAGLITIWVNLAVGMIGNEDNAINLALIALVPAALIGSGLARFRASAMAWIMAGAGTAQVGIGLIAGVFGTDFRGGVFTIILSTLWFLSAVLLRQAGRS